MKKIFFFILTLAMISFMACGPSADEEKKQKKIDDSLFEKDRNTALDNADKILSDSTTPVTDTAKKKDTKTKK